MTDNEDLARLVGDNRTELLRRLRDARSCLRDEYRKRFGKGYRFDFTNKRLVSTCGKYALQWKLRADPSSPPSYHNQQTSGGNVWLEKLQPDGEDACD